MPSDGMKRLIVRSTPEWLEWVARLGNHARLGTAGLIDEAVLRFAKEVGFDEPAPRRKKVG